MTPLLRPVGPLGASVYWVRRMIVLLAVVLVGWLVVWALPGGASGGAGDAAGHGARTGTAAASPTPTPAPSRSGSTRTPVAAARPRINPTSRTTSPPAAVAAGGHAGAPQYGVCAAGQVRMSVSLISTRVPSGTAVPVRIDIRNSSTRCGLSLGAADLRVQVTSGSDLIWDTKQCPAFVRSKLLTLEPGNNHAATVTWPGTRSRDGCPPRQATALPGYYLVQASVTGIGSDRVRFQIT